MIKGLKKVGILSAGIFLAFSAAGQQEPLFSQYMFNGLAINPAYAGSRDMLRISALYRNQWKGLEGAPQTSTISAHSPLPGSKIGLGLSVYHDQIGVFSETGVQADYAYRITFGESKLALGVRAAINHRKADWQSIETIDPNDPVYNTSNPYFVAPDFGVGFFFNNQTTYFGGSIPRLLRNDPFSGTSMAANGYSNPNRSLYLTGGKVLGLNPDIKIKPSVLLRYTESSPLQADLNTNIVFYDAFWIGASYRTRTATVLMIEFNVNPQFQFGYAVDIPSGAARAINALSHEMVLSYELSFDRGHMVNPRYF